MDSKGFTLIELIVTIGLLAIIGTMIATNMVGLQSKQMAQNYETYKSSIADSACVYVEMENATIYRSYDKSSKVTKNACLSATSLSPCYVYVDSLINDGYLDDDLEDPSTGESVTVNEYAKVYFQNGQKVCEYGN